MNKMTKEQAMATASELGISLEFEDGTRKKYQDLLHDIAEFKKANEASENFSKDGEIAKLKARIKELEVKHENRDSGEVPTHEQMMKGEILIAPPIPRNEKNTAQFRFEEELGYDMDYEEEKGEELLDAHEELQQGGVGYRIRGRKKNRVKAMTSGPRHNAGIHLKPAIDFCPKSKDPDTGKEGYQLCNPVYQGFLKIIESVANGLYVEKYRDTINKRSEWIGGFECIPVSLGNAIWKEIEREESMRDENDMGAYVR